MHAAGLTHHMQRQVQYAQVRLLENEGVVPVKPALRRRTLRVKGNLADLLPKRTNIGRTNQVCRQKGEEAQRAHGEKQAHRRDGQNLNLTRQKSLFCHAMDVSHCSTPHNPLTLTLVKGKKEKNNEQREKIENSSVDTGRGQNPTGARVLLHTRLTRTDTKAKARAKPNQNERQKKRSQKNKTPTTNQPP